MKGFKLPIISKVPIEVENKINKEVERDIAYSNLRQDKFHKLFNKPNSVLRKIGDYLLMNYQKGEISYKEIRDILGFSEDSIKLKVSELNFYKNFPLTMIPVPKRKGYIQSCLRNDTDYENWDLKKQRTIVSMEQVKYKAKKTTSAKEKTKKEIRNLPQKQSE